MEEIIKIEPENSSKPQKFGLENLSIIAKVYEKLIPFAENYIKNNPNSGFKSPEDVFTALVLGAELGLNPMTALKLGNVLNKDAIIAIWKGKALGVDPITALENIHVFETSKGLKTYTGYHIILEKLNFFGIKVEIVRDYENLYICQDFRDIKLAVKDKNVKIKLYKEETVIKSDRFFIVNENNKDNIPDDKIPVVITNNVYTIGTIVKFTKEVNGEKIIHYSSFTNEDAERAGLLNKDNYQKYPQVMFLSRCIGKGGRFIAAEYLKGIYTKEEVEDIE